jgi:hypothetical protein
VTSTPTGPLNSFETELLADLREHVAGRASAPAAPPPPRRRRRAIRMGVVAAIAAAAAAAAFGYVASRPDPAYAVSVGDDGRIHVSVHSMSDEAGLEHALAEKGVTADITYLPRGMVCEQPRATLHRVKGGHAFTMQSTKNGYDLTLSPVLADPSLTVVIESSLHGLAGASSDSLAVTVLVAGGPVSPCHAVRFATLAGR